MKTNGTTKAALAAGLCSSAVLAASACPSVLVPSYNAPSVASGWQAQLVAGGLTKPRSLQFDSTGALLVVESGKGVSRFTFTDNGGTCLQVDKSSLVIDETELNHGLALSNDGKTLYASTVESVSAWEYNPKTGKAGSTSRVVIDGMSNDDLVTRTLLVSKKRDGYIIVSRGGSEDLSQATVLSSGFSQIRAFDLSNLTSSSRPYDFGTSGRVLGWGLRNSVGVAEHPVSGGIYSVENSIDDVTRQGVDIHQNNPGEELNFHGTLDSTKDQGGNYGHPNCFAVWDTSEIPDNSGLAVGKQFAMTENSTMTDEICAKDFVPPRLTFPPHQAPLDIKFNAEGSVAYVSFHGSFNKKSPVGYRVSAISFNSKTGEPTADRGSTDALSDIMSNRPDNGACPDNCFRPAGLAWDAAGRLWMASDTTGEIYVLQKTSGSTPTTSSSGTIVTSTKAPGSGASALWSGSTAAFCYGAAAVAGALFVLV